MPDWSYRPKHVVFLVTVEYYNSFSLTENANYHWFKGMILGNGMIRIFGKSEEGRRVLRKLIHDECIFVKSILK
jgi:hypothetical protein